MKNTVTLLLAILITSQFSCSSNKAKEEKNARVIGAVPVADTVKPNRFANIKFASRFDTSCGMPLSSMLEDTLEYKGKIYGFCSKDCKDEFRNKLKEEQKKK